MIERFPPAFSTIATLSRFPFIETSNIVMFKAYCRLTMGKRSNRVGERKIQKIMKNGGILTEASCLYQGKLNTIVHSHHFL